jgi:hypothetical protein
VRKKITLCTRRTTHARTCVQPHVSLGGGGTMGATGWYGHGAGHPRQAVEAPAGQLHARPPRTCAMAGRTSHRAVMICGVRHNLYMTS